MKVLVVGFCKTGTKSMDAALEQLGYHVSDSLREAYELQKQWRKFFNGNGTSDDLRQMYAGFDATSDLPAFNHWREFLKAFPDIKLIFMSRDEESWIKSWNKNQALEDELFKFPIYHFSPTARKYMDAYYESMEDLGRRMKPITSFWKVSPKFKDDDMRRIFREHNQDVLANAPKDNFLHFKHSDGWEPLCRFLECDVPNVPYPHSNIKGAIYSYRFSEDRYMKKIYPEVYMSIAFLAVIISAIIYLLL